MILKVEDISFSYETGNQIFSDISFSLKKGEILSILGPNGIGKSTLIKCLVNVLPIDSGEIKLSGKNIFSLENSAIARKIGYVPQAHNIVFPFSVYEFVLMGRGPHLSLFSSPGAKDKKIAEKAIETVGISCLKNRPVSEISGGEHQLAMIARALTQEPDILLLDEPTSHLDFGNQIKILAIIEKLAKTGISVIMSTHYPDHGFLISDNVAIMQNGTFHAHGKTDDVISCESLKHIRQS